MPYLSVNSRLVSMMLWSECSFISHTDKIVILKTQICVFPPHPQEEMGGGAGGVTSVLIHILVGLWLEFQTQLGANSGSGGGGMEL